MRVGGIHYNGMDKMSREVRSMALGIIFAAGMFTLYVIRYRKAVLNGIVG